MAEEPSRRRLVVKPDQLQARQAESRTIAPGPEHPASFVVDSVVSEPLRAAISVVIETTSGIASPSAWGHAMTRTVTTRATVCSSNPPSTIVHTIAVISAAMTAK